MPYNVLENHAPHPATLRAQVTLENDLLRAELDDIRTKFGTLLAKLDADAGVTDTNYASTQALAARRWTAN